MPREEWKSKLTSRRVEAEGKGCELRGPGFLWRQEKTERELRLSYTRSKIYGKMPPYSFSTEAGILRNKVYGQTQCQRTIRLEGIQLYSCFETAADHGTIFL